MVEFSVSGHAVTPTDLKPTHCTELQKSGRTVRSLIPHSGSPQTAATHRSLETLPGSRWTDGIPGVPRSVPELVEAMNADVIQV